MNRTLRAWNGYTMRGRTDYDENLIHEWLLLHGDEELVVDDCNRLMSSADETSRVYIADIQDVEDGEGHYC